MNRRNNIYVDIHVLQTVPPSCVNRDDTGSPKTAVYGGVTRARVSSQAWKRAVRVMFREDFAKEQVGIRTKDIPALLAKEIMAQNGEVDEKKAMKLALEALKSGEIGLKKKKNSDEMETDALFFISRAQITALASAALKDVKDKKECKDALSSNPSIDIALFGRMVASDPSLNFDAAAQVAHAISTHAVHNEYDYFTAVDDCSPEDTAGAGHLGTVEYNSSTLYRYATVNVNELNSHLGADTVEAVTGFVSAFIRSMPTGKQNTFANRTLPDAVYVTVRRDQPVNLAGAFEKPVRSAGEGYAEGSVLRLAAYANELYSSFAEPPQKAWTAGRFEELGELGESIPLKGILSELGCAIGDALSGVEV